MRRTPIVSVILIVLSLGSLLFLAPSPSYSWRGRVITVPDGDTLKVLHEKEYTTIRLYGVDTPEHGQSFGRKAKQCTADLVYRKIVDVEPLSTDSYGRPVALIRLEDGTLVNQELIKAGFAWVYTRYCRQPLCLEWKRLEDEAREGMSGLWKDKNPIPPWEWREIHREQR